jgi:hypothetical protein
LDPIYGRWSMMLVASILILLAMGGREILENDWSTSTISGWWLGFIVKKTIKQVRKTKREALYRST